MDLVPDHVLFEHLLPLLDFLAAVHLYSSCARFRRLLSARMLPRLEVLGGGGGTCGWAEVRAAAEGGFRDVVEFMVEERAFRDWDWGMYYAAEGGHRELVEYFVVMGASNFKWGMTSAARGGHRELVEYFVAMGATNWDMGMQYAAVGGHRDLVDYFVERGASDWNWGIAHAVVGEHWDLVEYLERKLRDGAERGS